MSGVRGRVWNRLLVATVLAWGAGLRGATPPSGDGTEGGISGAKRDYETIKAPADNAAERPNIDLPPAPTLELKTETAVPGTTRRGRKLTEQERLRELEREKEKSRDWLIEAMARQEQPATAATNPDATSIEPNAAELDRAAKLMALLDAISAKPVEGAATAETASAADLRDTPAVLNPLDRYMASWMTAGDFKLLGPKPDSGAALGGAELLPPLPDAASRSGAQPFADPGSGAYRESAGMDNPYLRDTAVFAPPPANLADLPAPNGFGRPNSIPPFLAPNAPAEPPPPPSFSEQLKAQDEAKYFKQLKRF